MWHHYVRRDSPFQTAYSYIDIFHKYIRDSQFRNRPTPHTINRNSGPGPGARTRCVHNIYRLELSRIITMVIMVHGNHEKAVRSKTRFSGKYEMIIEPPSVIRAFRALKHSNGMVNTTGERIFGGRKHVVHLHRCENQKKCRRFYCC